MLHLALSYSGTLHSAFFSPCGGVFLDKVSLCGSSYPGTHSTLGWPQTHRYPFASNSPSTEIKGMSHHLCLSTELLINLITSSRVVSTSRHEGM